MDRTKRQSALGGPVWGLIKRQHGVVARRQLLALGLSEGAIQHRLLRGRLFPIGDGVYAVGRPTVDRSGLLMAAVLGAGPTAVLSCRSAGELWGLLGPCTPIEVSVRTWSHRDRRRDRILVHRCVGLRDEDVGQVDGIPVTGSVRTLVDLAALHRDRTEIEKFVNEADRLDLIDPERLRGRLRDHRGQRGVARLRAVLDRHSFRLTDSELERWFLPITERAGLAILLTQRRVNGFKVDFYWPGNGLVVETDGLRYHRTPAEQARDRLRDQTHTAAGLTQLRFTHGQIRFDPDHVVAILRDTARRVRDPDRRDVQGRRLSSERARK